MRHSIFLIGFAGCGKTRLGKKIAKKFDMPFIDLDEAIEIETGQTIEVLINKWGEPRFREIEHTVLKKLLTLPHFVMATGGGTACFHDNINMINATGISIYISMRAEALAQRLL
ncbi:MAG TPA: shikimate kinase, partial [Bacteroidales bacterium]|nr:shikimate kinase [Bacteroidales bacterium]